MRKCAEVLMKIWRNLDVLGSCVENLIPGVESYAFCNDVLEMAQNRLQPEVGPKILFSVLANTIPNC